MRLTLSSNEMPSTALGPSSVASPIGWILAIQDPFERVVRDVLTCVIQLIPVPDYAVIVVTLPQPAWERCLSVLAYADDVFMGGDGLERLGDPADGLW